MIQAQDKEPNMDSKSFGDGVLVTAAVTSPTWVDMLSGGLGLATLAGGVILLGFRIIAAWREYRKWPK